MASASVPSLSFSINDIAAEGENHNSNQSVIFSFAIYHMYALRTLTFDRCGDLSEQTEFSWRVHCGLL